MKKHTDGISYGKTAGGSCFPDDTLHSRNFIRMQTDHRRRIWLKTVSCFVAFTFLFQQVTYGFDFASLRTPSVAAQGESISLIDRLYKEIKVTNYDLLSKKRNQSVAGGLFSSKQEREQDAAYAPHYLKRQQAKHEEIMRQKQDTEDLMLMINDKHKQRYDEDMPLKKKQSASPKGGIYYTLEDFGAGGPKQLNRYIYQGGRANGPLLEVISYDISGLGTGEWQAKAKEIEPDEGDPFIGSTSPMQNDAGLTQDRIISRTIYSGRKNKEVVQHVFSGYDEEGKPSEITNYDYSGENQQTMTYSLSGLDVSMRATVDKTTLSDDMLIRKTVYEGSIEDGSIDYVLDTYTKDEEGENSPNRVSVYDYASDEGGALREVRSYGIEGMDRADWFNEALNADKLETVTVYEGAKDKEKVQYILSSFFLNGEVYLPWERTDYVYGEEGESEKGILKKTRKYDISELGASEGKTSGEGRLEEEMFYTGDKGYEKMDYGISSFGSDGKAQTLTDYTYDGKAMRTAEVYDIAGGDIENKGALMEKNIYEGRSGKEILMNVVSYHSNGEILKNVAYTYDKNSSGIDYVSFTDEKVYSEEGELMERVEVTNGLEYIAADGEQSEDANGNIRMQNVKSYSFMGGIEYLSKEEDVVFSEYTSLKQPKQEERTTYGYDEEGVKIGREFRETFYNEFDSRGNVVSQTINNYGIDEDGSRVYENTQDIHNQFTDYKGNVFDRTETVWLDIENRSEENLLFHKVMHSEYDDITARMRGNATYTESMRYTSLTLNEENKIDRTVMIAEEFDMRGYFVKQSSQNYVTDENGVERLKQIRDTVNADLNVRGDARTQTVSIYQTDENGDLFRDENEEVVASSYQVFTNRMFDTRQNVLNQMILSYSSDDEEDRVLLDVQEIRFMGFSSSGVALKQVVAVYGDEDKSLPVDLKTIENFDISSLGNVGRSVTTKYATADIEDKDGDIAYSDPIDRQVIINSSFDLRGNAHDQKTIRTSYDEGDGEFVFTEVQTIENISFDTQDRTEKSIVRSYSGEEITPDNFVDMQVLNYMEYDMFGNMLEQTIDTYDTQDESEAGFIDHKRITNDYRDPETGQTNLLAQRRGSAVTSTVMRYDSMEENSDTIVDSTVTETTEFNEFGHAVSQVSDTYVKEKLTTRREIHNLDINVRGDSATQEITTYVTDETGAEDTLDIVNYQVMTNRQFDSNHNLTAQTILT